jgi:hypothetical protein
MRQGTCRNQRYVRVPRVAWGREQTEGRDTTRRGVASNMGGGGGGVFVKEYGLCTGV